MKPSTWKLPCRLLVLLTAAAVIPSCALYRNDRCFVPQEQYLLARDLFIQTGSLDLVKRRLVEYQWQRCRINEAIYRLTKEFEALPEELTPDEQAASVTP